MQSKDWIRVAAQPIPENTPLLLATNEHMFIGEVWRGWGKPHLVFYWGLLSSFKDIPDLADITHWQPLPKPPSQESTL